MRQCICVISNDEYYGSGSWVKCEFSRYGKQLFKILFEKEIIEVCFNIDSLKLREKDIIGNRWKNDKLCMNRVPGGCAYVSGIEHPHSDVTKYHLYDIIDGVEVFKTRYDLLEYGVSLSATHNFLKSKTKLLGGRFVKIEHQQHDVGYNLLKGGNNYKFDHTVYKFYDNLKKEAFHMTKRQLCEKYNINYKNINKMMDGKCKLSGVSLYDNRDMVYEFKYEGKTLKLTKHECMDIFRIDRSTMSKLMHGKIEKAKGVSLSKICS